MKIFLTGTTGFIGKHVLDKLSQNPEHKFLVLSRKDFIPAPNIEVINSSLEELNSWSKQLREFQPDVCIHLAWQGIPDHSHAPSLRNLQNSISLFLLLKEINCKKVIVSGSCFEYGTKSGILSEEDLPKPTDPFTAAKLSILIMGQDLFKNTPLKFIWARFFYVYGPGQREASLIPTIVSSIKSGKIPEIRKPDARNDFVYVGDVAKAIKDLTEKEVDGGIYNVGTGETTSIRQIISLAYEKTGIPQPPIEAKGGENIDFKADISKIKDMAGWAPVMEIGDGISAYLNSLN